MNKKRKKKNKKKDNIIKGATARITCRGLYVRWHCRIAAGRAFSVGAPAERADDTRRHDGVFPSGTRDSRRPVDCTPLVPSPVRRTAILHTAFFAYTAYTTHHPTVDLIIVFVVPVRGGERNARLTLRRYASHGSIGRSRISSGLTRHTSREQALNSGRDRRAESPGPVVVEERDHSRSAPHANSTTAIPPITTYT